MRLDNLLVEEGLAKAMGPPLFREAPSVSFTQTPNTQPWNLLGSCSFVGIGKFDLSFLWPVGEASLGLRVYGFVHKYQLQK